jgi:hypothetical protein
VYLSGGSIYPKSYLMVVLLILWYIKCCVRTKF